MSSPYVKLGNRTLDQWKVTELREELKKRKLPIKGLKEELVKRLDEAIRNERKNASDGAENDEKYANQSELPPEQAQPKTDVSGGGKDFMDVGISINEKADLNPALELDDPRSLFEGRVEVSLEQGTKDSEMEGSYDDQAGTVDTTTVVISKTVESVTVVSEENIRNDGSTDIDPSKPETQLPVINERSKPLEPYTRVQSEALNSSIQMETDDPKYPEMKSGVPTLKQQVSKVDTDLGLLVKSECVSISEKVELKVDAISDNVQPITATSDGEPHPLDAEEPLDIKETEDPLDKRDAKEPLKKKEVERPLDEMVDNLKNIDEDDLVNEKLNLDRSSGDDSMEEDIVESKNDENVERSARHALKEEDNVDVVSHDKPVKIRPNKDENEAVSTEASAKRKLHDISEKAPVGNNDPVKKARKDISTTPMGFSEPSFKPSTGTDPTVNEEASKERVVPPSSRASTNSLRIDRFLRPFTLKQVQELLGKTGNVTGFWMDHIKTHCYVSFSSVEEAVDTRNALYNIQWPPNGGRLLVAEFVDNQEVKARIEAPPLSPLTTPSAAVPPQNNVPLQPSPGRHVLRHHQLPPPPPLANPPPLTRDRPRRETLPPREQPILGREWLNNVPLPPPPPLAEKAEPPIVTLDDLFCKTKATPRIYYLPLSDEDVEAKTKGQGKNVVN